MDLRAQFQAAAANAAHTYINNIRQMEETGVFMDTLEDAPRALIRGRQLENIVIDDMMERFAIIMAASPDRAVIPGGFYHWLTTQRFGTNNITRQESDAELARAISEARKQFKPNIMPEFLQVISEALSGAELADLTNKWNNIFTQVVRLTTTDESMLIHHTNNLAQNEMVKQANASIAQKSKVEKLRRDADSDSDEDDDNDSFDDLGKIGKKISQLEMPEAIKEEVLKLYKHTRKLNPQMSEFSVNCKRLDIITSLPWGQYKEMNRDIKKAQEILDDDHYGLEKVKAQIIQHMAVQNRTGVPDGKILLLVGPPGVGKTSIAQSVAKATGREYIRVSLGGVHKESDIRGHSSTYVGAMPGRIIQEIKKAKSSNPLVVLDEIDKLGSGSANGDPSAALLEVLDPAQNHTFRDDYLGVEFDLSKVLFFCTANDLSTIPGPLRDRMQIVSLSSYLQDEKYEIATRYLIPKQMKAKKLTDAELVIEPAAIKALIGEHTAEAGVRNLEKKIEEICSRVVVDLATGKEGVNRITPANLTEYVGPGHGDRDRIPAQDMVGVVNGLAYTSIGGTVLPIESSVLPANGFRMTVSGNLGKVMGESAGVAERLVRARAPQFGISDNKLARTEISVHCPAGAVPKDGPSAGAAFTTAIISALTGIPVHRDVAMTGEINSRGEVTAIGGLREKLEGALNAGVKTVLIPRQNIPNLADVPEKVKSQLTVIPVGTIEEVLKYALTEEIKPLSSTPKSWTTRFRDAWAVLTRPSNDNAVASVRQAAGARHRPPAP